MKVGKRKDSFGKSQWREGGRSAGVGGNICAPAQGGRGSEVKYDAQGGGGSVGLDRQLGWTLLVGGGVAVRHKPISGAEGRKKKRNWG